MSVIETVANATATRLPALRPDLVAQLEAAGLTPAEQAEILNTKSKRTAIGWLWIVVGVLAGGAILTVQLLLVLKNGLPAFSLWLFLGGLGVIVGGCLLGATTWSTELMATPIKTLLAFLGGLADIVRGRNAVPPAPPTP